MTPPVLKLLPAQKVVAAQTTQILCRFGFRIQWVTSDWARSNSSQSKSPEAYHPACPTAAQSIGWLASNATPSRYVTNRLEIASTLAPGTIIPTRFNGSAAEIVIVSPVGGSALGSPRGFTAGGGAK